MNVTVKVVVFKNTNRPDRKLYCSYCPELEYFFGDGNTIEEVLNDVKKILIRELKNRFKYRNLKIRNWEISENSIIPPKFTDEEAVELTKDLYELPKLENMSVNEISVNVPKDN